VVLSPGFRLEWTRDWIGPMGEEGRLLCGRGGAVEPRL
jgi:hypothetical protein